MRLRQSIVQMMRSSDILRARAGEPRETPRRDKPHTVRGAFAGAQKKRLGLTVVSEKVEGRGRIYRTDG